MRSSLRWSEALYTSSSRAPRMKNAPHPRGFVCTRSSNRPGCSSRTGEGAGRSRRSSTSGPSVARNGAAHQEDVRRVHRPPSCGCNPLRHRRDAKLRETSRSAGSSPPMTHHQRGYFRPRRLCIRKSSAQHVIAPTSHAHRIEPLALENDLSNWLSIDALASQVRTGIHPANFSIRCSND